MRIDNVLSKFGESSGEAPLVPHQMPQRVKTCKKREFICHLFIETKSVWQLWESWSHCHFFLCWLHHTVFTCKTLIAFFLLFQSHLHLFTGGRGVRTARQGLSLCDVTNLSPTAYSKFSCGGARPSETRCSTPDPARKRRCTMVVDYKEPTLNA